MVWKSLRKALKNLRKETEKRQGFESYLEGKRVKSEWLIFVMSEGEGQLWKLVNKRIFGEHNEEIWGLRQRLSVFG